jgi:hypothetical protein
MPVEFPERFNMADYFLYHNLEEGRENKVCLHFKIKPLATAKRLVCQIESATGCANSGSRWKTGF